MQRKAKAAQKFVVILADATKGPDAERPGPFFY
jgi:hypothetical protein